MERFCLLLGLFFTLLGCGGKDISPPFSHQFNGFDQAHYPMISNIKKYSTSIIVSSLNKDEKTIFSEKFSKVDNNKGMFNDKDTWAHIDSTTKAFTIHSTFNKMHNDM